MDRVTLWIQTIKQEQEPSIQKMKNYGDLIVEAVKDLNGVESKRNLKLQRK